jgi:hypothetical protein
VVFLRWVLSIPSKSDIDEIAPLAQGGVGGIHSRNCSIECNALLHHYPTRSDKPVGQVLPKFSFSLPS